MTAVGFNAVPRYGRRKSTGMIGQFDTLRQAIRAEGTPAIQSALDAIEEHVDAAYQWASEREDALRIARHALDQWEAHVESEFGGCSKFGPMMAEVNAQRAALAKLGG